MEEIWIEVGRESFPTRKDLCEAIDSNIKLGWQFYDYTTYPMLTWPNRKGCWSYSRN